MDEAKFKASLEFFEIETGAGDAHAEGEESVGDVPVLVAGVEIDFVEGFGVVAPRGFEGGGEAAFLFVPAVESFDVAGGVIEVVEGGVDGEVGEAAEGLEPGGDVGGGEAGAGEGIEGEVEVAVGASLEVEAVAEEDAEGVGAGASELELGEGPLGVEGEGEGVVEEGGAEAGSGGEGEVVDDGLAGAIPIFEGGVEIAVEEVDGGEEVEGVVVAGGKAQGSAEVAFCGGVIFALKGDAGEFLREAGVLLREMLADEEGGGGLIGAVKSR